MREDERDAAAEPAWRRRLRDAIAADGRGVVEISLAAGLNRAYLTGLLRSDSSPRLDALSRVCDVLGVSVSWIVDGVPIAPAERRFVTMFSRLAEERRATVLQVLEAMATAPYSPGREAADPSDASASAACPQAGDGAPGKGPAGNGTGGGGKRPGAADKAPSSPASRRGSRSPPPEG